MIRRLAFLLLFACSAANAQFNPGQILTAAQLNSAFANVLGIAGGTLTGPLTVPALTVTGDTIVSNLTVNGTLTASGVISPSSLAPQIPNSLIGNVSNSTQSPGVVGLPSGCNSNTSALNYAYGAGFICNTNVNASTLGGQTFAAPGPIGSSVASTGSFTNLTASGTVTLPSGSVALSNLAAQAANTVVANVTGSSASPTAFVMPSCSAANSALQYTSGTGWSCGTTFAITGGTLAQFAATTSAQLAGVVSDETGSGALVFGTSPTIASPTVTGTLTATNITASGTLTGFTGRLLNVQTFTATGTYTPTTGTNSVIVQIIGGGGAGGGTPATSGTQNSVGGAGGSGAWAIGRITSGFSGVTVTIGAAGAGSAGAVGGNGGQSSFGALITAPGGIGGSLGTLLTSGVGVAIAGATSSNATGANMVNSPGNSGVMSVYSFGNFLYSNPGASSPFGSGGTAIGASSAGSSASGKGAGGSGAAANASQAALAGGNGAAGLCIIYEYQ